MAKRVPLTRPVFLRLAATGTAGVAAGCAGGGSGGGAIPGGGQEGATATPSASASATASPTTTAIASASSSPTASASGMPTVTPTASSAPTSTPTSNVGATSSPTASPSPTPSATGSPTSTPAPGKSTAPTPTATPTTTPTVHPTSTPAPTHSPTATPATPSPTPTSTPSPGVTPPPGATKVTITVSSSSSGTVGTDFAGFSYEKWDIGNRLFTGSTPLVGLFQLLGPSLLRLGANYVDKTPWNANGAGGSGSEIAPSDIDQLAAFIQATGWKVLYGIGCFTNGNTPGSTQNTPANAASEAAYVAHALGNSLWAFEIGNEPNHYGNDKETVAQYDSTFFNPWVSAIKAAVPGAVFAGPGPGHDDDFAVSFASAEGSKIMALTDHYYFGDAEPTTGSPPAASGLLTAVTDIASAKAMHAAQISNGISQWRMTEANTYYMGGLAGASNAFYAALWVLDFLNDMAANGASGANIHGGTSAQFGLNNGNSATLIYSPIDFNTPPQTTPFGVRPLYYGMYLFTLAGTGPLHAASISGGTNITAYGIGKNVIIVNKTSSALAATVTLPTAPNGAQQILLTAPELSSTSATIGGATIGLNGAVSPQANTCSVSGSSLLAVVPGNSAVVVITS
jgi:hypothetical protein